MTTAEETQRETQPEPEFDVFVCHASEDKAELVAPLVDALKAQGVKVWYDADQIRLGDDFRLSMEKGLTRSRYGVVVVSPSFKKYWPQAELSVMFSLEAMLWPVLLYGKPWTIPTWWVKAQLCKLQILFLM